MKHRGLGAVAFVIASATAAIAQDSVSIFGTFPGMTHEEVKVAASEAGFLDLIDTPGPQQSRIMEYYRRSDDAVLNVDIALSQSDQPAVYRVTTIVPLQDANRAAEAVAELSEKFQNGADCNNDGKGAAFHYNASWERIDTGSCEVPVAWFTEVMKPETIAYFSQPRDWRYTIIAGKAASEGKEYLVVSAYDNLELLRIERPGVKWAKPDAVQSTLPAAQSAPVAPSAPAQPAVAAQSADQSDAAEFGIRSIHGVSLGMPTDAAIQALLSAGFTAVEPPTAYGANEIRRSSDGRRYLLERDYESHDRFAKSETHFFKSGDITVDLHIYPAGLDGRVGIIKRHETLAESVFAEAALKQLIERAGGMQPHCQERQQYGRWDFAWALTSEWQPLKTAKRGGLCLNGPYLGLAKRFARDLNEIDSGEKGSIQFIAGTSRNNAVKMPQGHINVVNFALYDSRRITESVIAAYADSKAARAAQSSKKGISDF